MSYEQQIAALPGVGVDVLLAQHLEGRVEGQEVGGLVDEMKWVGRGQLRVLFAKAVLIDEPDNCGTWGSHREQRGR